MAVNRITEEGVLLSLGISLGMILLAVIGWWMWKILVPIMEAMFTLPPGEMP